MLQQRLLRLVIQQIRVLFRMVLNVLMMFHLVIKRQVLKFCQEQMAMDTEDINLRQKVEKLVKIGIEYGHISIHQETAIAILMSRLTVKSTINATRVNTDFQMQNIVDVKVKHNQERHVQHGINLLQHYKQIRFQLVKELLERITSVETLIQNQQYGVTLMKEIQILNYVILQNWVFASQILNVKEQEHVLLQPEQANVKELIIVQQVILGPQEVLVLIITAEILVIQNQLYIAILMISQRNLKNVTL